MIGLFSLHVKPSNRNESAAIIVLFIHIIRYNFFKRTNQENQRLEIESHLIVRFLRPSVKKITSKHYGVFIGNSELKDVHEQRQQRPFHVEYIETSVLIIRTN